MSVPKAGREHQGFYIHFTIYLIMVPVFIYLNIISHPFRGHVSNLWMGMGIAGHAFEAFNYNPILGRKWEEQDPGTDGQGSLTVR